MFKKHNLNENIIYGGVFLLFSAVIIGATLYYSCWWSVVDDARNLVIAADFWKLPGLASFWQLVKTEVVVLGRFRPVYQLWIISAYSIFSAFPVGLYLFMALAGLGSLLLWGRMINKIFTFPGSASFNLFVYPLSFFLFTPFWNNFMYISVLEKFVYFFATFSIYFYIRAYEANRVADIVISFLFMILGVLGKETGIALTGVFCAYSFLDYLVLRKNRRLSLISFVGNASIFIGYSFFVRCILTGMGNLHYKNNFNPAAIVSSLLAAPLVIKFFIFVAIIFFCIGTALIIRKRNYLFAQEYLLFPLFVGVYLLMISPVGFINYQLTPVAPFLLMTCYPVYALIGSRGRVWRKTINGILMVLISIVLFFIIVPRISKMGDTKKIVSAVVSLGRDRLPAKFFMGPPFHETATVMQAYIHADIAYLSTGLLDQDSLNDQAVNYIIFEDRCSSVVLRDVAVVKEVYSNETWKVFSLTRALGKNMVLEPVFKRNLIQRLSDVIKSVR